MDVGWTLLRLQISPNCENNNRGTTKVFDLRLQFFKVLTVEKVFEKGKTMSCDWRLRV